MRQVWKGQAVPQLKLPRHCFDRQLPGLIRFDVAQGPEGCLCSNTGHLYRGPDRRVLMGHCWLNGRNESHFLSLGRLV